MLEIEIEILNCEGEKWKKKISEKEPKESGVCVNRLLSRFRRLQVIRFRGGGKERYTVRDAKER